MKKLLSFILIVVFLMFMLAVPVPATAADRENFSVGNLDVQRGLSVRDAGALKYLGYGVNWTLTREEAKHTTLRVSSGNGTPSILDPYAKAGQMRFVRVEAGGAQVSSVYIKGKSTETGVSIAISKGAWVQYLCTGTTCRYHRMTADSNLY